MKAEIVAVGTELLLGQIVDTNSAHIARQLTTVGLDVHFKSTVGDNLDRLKATLHTALNPRRPRRRGPCEPIAPTETPRNICSN